MMILGIDHVQLAMPAGREAEARSFYQDLLGMEEIPKPLPMRASGGVWFRAGEAELHLGVEDDFRPARKAHPALRVVDLDAYAERIRESGLDLTWDERYPGFRRFFVDDPFRNRIELLESEAGRGAAWSANPPPRR